LSRWERGHAVPTGETLTAYLAVLDRLRAIAETPPLSEEP
jgi:hypothetical protein